MKKNYDITKYRKGVKDAVLAIAKEIQRNIDNDDEEITREHEEILVLKGSLSTTDELLGYSTKVEVIGDPITQFVEILQGVTWGGDGCEGIFDMSEDQLSDEKIEGDLARQRIGGEDIKKWSIQWSRRYLLFPYVYNEKEQEWNRSFDIRFARRRSAAFKELGINDSLRLDQLIDESEKRIMKSKDAEHEKHERILQHRIALGLVRYPHAAKYLIKHYDKLAKRKFEEKTMEEYNKTWYEYHRKRSPKLLRRPRIVGPRLVKTARFAIDERGYLPRDSVVSLIPKEQGFKKLRRTISDALGRNATNKETLLFLLCFLNCSPFNKILADKVSKKRGGYPTIDEKILAKLRIPTDISKSGNTVARLIELADKIIHLAKEGDLKTDAVIQEYEHEIDELVARLYDEAEKNREQENQLRISE